MNEHLEHSHSHEAAMQWWKPAVSAIMLGVGMAMSAAGVAWFEPVWVRALWYFVAFLPVGLGVMHEAIEEVRDGDIFSEFMLMSIAAIGAFAIGEFPESVAVMLLYSIGETLQDKAVERARGDIRSLLAFKPEKVTVVRDDHTLTLAPEDVAVGETIEVKPGERVPLDGILLSGDAALDTSALTGESVPRTISTGEEVLAGMISSSGVLRIKVSRVASESAISRILNMVENATERKAPTELLIHRFARIYTPVVIGLAVLVVLLPWLYSLVSPSFNYQFASWLHRALVFLVISCPCALVISVPLSYFAGIGAASRRGILFKGSTYLDIISSIDTVAFDKTGTLTTGHFAVTDVSSLTDEQIAICAAIEQNSNHPIAHAIVEYAHKKGLNIDLAQNSQKNKNIVSGKSAEVCGSLREIKEVAGRGLNAQLLTPNSSLLTVEVGNLRLLRDNNIPYPAELDDIKETLVVVAIDGAYIGYLLLSDQPKDDATAAIASLNQRDINSIILSGDKQPLVRALGNRLGVKAAYGDLLPEGKVEKIKQLQNEGKNVAFVGDGINDAPTLATANLGIAMGALGSDMAIETADVVLQTDQPSRVPEAIDIGKRTRRIVWQNIIFAIVIKLIIMIASVCGFDNLWLAVFADVGVALLCIANALRIFISHTKQ